MNYDFKENAELSRELASNSMVLLKNEESILPFEGNTPIAIFGKGQIEFVKGGTGSADVFSPYTVNLLDGMQSKSTSGHVVVNDDLANIYKSDSEIKITPEIINDAAEVSEVALLTISRISGEGSDRDSVKGDYYLSDEENDLISDLENSAFKSIVIVLNAGAVLDLSWIEKYPKIKSVLLAYLPGMEGGNAIADVLCGDVNPSGKLTSTFANSYDVYPSSSTFKRSKLQVEYEERIFVGYRYFETIPEAKDQVIYPFGFGLSYTKFDIKNINYKCDNNMINVSCDVTNTGARAGREVIQLYSSSPEGNLDKAAIELRSYHKTKLLAPGEKENISLSFDVNDMASFDDSGATGHAGSFVLEKGIYKIFLGNSIRNTTLSGEYEIASTRAVLETGLKLTTGVTKGLQADGKWESTKIVSPHSSDNNSRVVSSFIDRLGDAAAEVEERKEKDPNEIIKLIDVAQNKATMDDFIAQFTTDELVTFCHAQPPAFPRGTAGVGNHKKYGVPNPQTADGPAGLRKSVPTTCFPCATLMASSWDEELQYKMGKALGYEAVTTGIDIMLAPGLNIHRDPLCGRNFEYYSEDPLISGKTAAAVVRGIQSEGVGATMKHFAINNKEEARHFCNSVIDERTAREIYLRGFEIAVKESSPWCIMSSYNLINGRKASTIYNLLTGILRDEWGYDGIVMTDWRTSSHLWEEIAAGNDIKMPFGYQNEIDMAVANVNYILEREAVIKSVKRIMNLVMKTAKFRNQDFGVCHTIHSEQVTKIKAAEITAVSSTWSKVEPCLDTDGGLCCTELCKDPGGHDTYLIYNLDIAKAGSYDLALRVATPFTTSKIEVILDKQSLAVKPVPSTQKEGESVESAWQTWTTLDSIPLELPEGEHTINICIRDKESGQGVNVNYLEFTPK